MYNLKVSRIELQNSERIFIVGVSGSGKSTLAQTLSKRYDLPHIDMDDIVYPPPDYEHISEQEFFKQARDLSEKPKLIIEGVYIFGMDPVLQRANNIIWLDASLPTILRDVFLRETRRKLAGNNRHSFKDTADLMRFLVRFHYPNKVHEKDPEDTHISRNKTIKILEPYKDKLITLRSRGDISDFLRNEHY